MIEICLNPDNETVGGEVFENLDGVLGWVVFDKFSRKKQRKTENKQTLVDKQGYPIEKTL